MSNRRNVALVAIMGLGAAGAACWGQCQKGWKPTDGKPGLDSPAYSLAVWDDGRGPALYMAGDFARIGDIAFSPRLDVARWDGNGWEALPNPGPQEYSFSELAVHDGFLVASGPGVLRWNGISWSSLGLPYGFEPPLLSHGGLLYADTPSPQDPYALAVWDGLTWSVTAFVPPGATQSEVYALASHEGSVFLGGGFNLPGGIQSGVARLVGSTYELVGSVTTGASSGVEALQSYNGELLVGGSGLWRVKGNGWYRCEPPPSNNGDALNAYVTCLGAYAGDLIVGGRFTEVGPVVAMGLARWNGVQWNSLSGGGVVGNANVNALCEFNGQLIVAGDNLLTPLYQRVGRWTGSTWKPLGLGFENAIRCFAVVNGQLHAGGFFRYTGGEPSNHVAVYDGFKWNPRNSGMNDWVLALGSYNGQPVAGGSFTQASGQNASRIARWDSASWQPLAGGVDGKVYALAELGGVLYAGGAFTQADSVSRPHVAAWNGAQWSDVGGGVDGNVRALHVFGGQVVAGGEFNTAGATPASRIALWTGSAWQALGAGMNDDVHALTTFNGMLVAAGEFTQAGGTPANYIAAWDGAAWQPLGAGLNGPVWALTEYEGDLLVGGRFATAGGQPALNIARWDGAAWHALGNGVGTAADEVRALAVIDGDLHVGGSFNVVNAGAADQRICAFWARWGTIGPPGDADHDHDVDQDDMDLILFNFGRSARPGFNGDVTGDLVVDQDDLDLVLFNFGATCP